MKKLLLSTITLALVAMTGAAQKPVVWENPSAFMGDCIGDFFITKVELKSTETVMHLTAHYPPNNWIRFDKYSFLLTPDGRRYTITSGAKTNDKESDLTPDSLFWMPESGMAHLALHFKPVPLNTKVMDFLESYNERDFKLWNISDNKTIDGDHYYLTKEQYSYILDKYEAEGIPTYAIYDTEGNQTFKHIGFSGLDIFKNAVNEVLK